MRSLALSLFFSAVWLATDGAISCENYNPMICLPDLKGFCLTNGTMMMGTCDAQAAICRDGATEAADMGCCTGTASCAALTVAPTTTGPNTAPTTTGNAATFHGPAALLTAASVSFRFLHAFIL